MPHGEFNRWLLRDEQKELFEALFAGVLTILFLGLSALALWPAGRASMTYRLMKGYLLLCIMLSVTSGMVALIQRMFRVDIESHFDAYVISSLGVSGVLQAGWSAFAALTAHSFITGAPLRVAVILYFVGFLSCYIAYSIVSAFYVGSIYRRVNLPLAFAGFIIFSVWPAGGRAIYGWFFGLF
jgi:hypothetical protein